MVVIKLLFIPFLALMLLQQEEEAPSISCYNDGRHPSNSVESHECMCDIACNPDNPHGNNDVVKYKCKSYCRRDHCHCKAPCA